MASAPNVIVFLVEQQSTTPRFPIGLALFGQGSQVSVCSESCMDELEGDWYPGVRFAYMAEPALQTGTCAACIICGRTTVMPRNCLLHDGSCPDIQWIQTLTGMTSAKAAYEKFGRTLGDRVLITLEWAARRRPSTDPLDLIRRMRVRGQ